MERISIEIGLRSPVSIAIRRGVDNVLRTLDFIPGTTWRGAFAKAYINKYGQDTAFNKIFVEGGAWFSDLLPDRSRVIPYTAFSCKYAHGFLDDDAMEKPHGVLDILCDTVLDESFGTQLQPANCSADDCHDTPLENVRGFYKRDGTKYTHVTAQKSLLGHTAIDPRTQTAKESQFYVLETLDAGQRFHGDIIVQDRALSCKLQQAIPEIETILVGSDLTRGLGRASLRIDPSVTALEDKTLQKRIENFNARFADAAENLFFFSLTLESRAIVLDKYLRYKSIIEPEDLQAVCPNPLWEHCHLIRAWNSTSSVDGWNSKARFPKLSETAIDRGAVFVFAVKAEHTTADQLCRALQQIEEKGIGERREEGFGRVTVCQQFHWEGDNK